MDTLRYHRGIKAERCQRDDSFWAELMPDNAQVRVYTIIDGQRSPELYDLIFTVEQWEQMLIHVAARRPIAIKNFWTRVGVDKASFMAKIRKDGMGVIRNSELDRLLVDSAVALQHFLDALANGQMTIAKLAAAPTRAIVAPEVQALAK